MVRSICEVQLKDKKVRFDADVVLKKNSRIIWLWQTVCLGMIMH